MLRLKETAEELKPDVLVLAGDMTRLFKPGPGMDLLSTIPVPILGIRGNCDATTVDRSMDRLPGFTKLTAEPVEMDGVFFFGAGGCLPLPFYSRVGFFEQHALDELEAGMAGKSPAVVVIHPPPRWVRDKVLGRFSAGSPGVRRFVETTRPRVLICGHVHEQAGWDHLGPTLVVNCAMNRKYKGALIHMEPGKPPEAQMLKTKG